VWLLTSRHLLGKVSVTICGFPIRPDRRLRNCLQIQNGGSPPALGSQFGEEQHHACA
jgi:hypothetical protein